MKLTFGNCNDDGNETQIKQVCEDAFGNLAEVAGFKKLYIAVPHANNYTDFAPTKKDKDQLEIYICATPTFHRSREFVTRLEKLKFSGTEYKLEKGQFDRLGADSDLTYEEMTDEFGNLFAMRRNNQLWILQDLFHPTMKADTVHKILRELCLYLDGKRAPFDATGLIVDIMADCNKKDMERLQSEKKTYERRVAEAQDAFTQRLTELADYNRRMDAYKFNDMDLATAMAKRVMKMPLIQKIGKLQGTTQGIQILTKPIMQGPFNYGQWIIKISPDANPAHSVYPAEIAGTATRKVRHPHDQLDEQGKYQMCIGGFDAEIVRTQKSGEWDIALTYYRQFITNYTSSHRFTPLEEYLSAVMGKDEFKAAFDSVLETSAIKPSTHDKISIVTLFGNELTVIGVNKKNGATDRDVIILQ